MSEEKVKQQDDFFLIDDDDDDSMENKYLSFKVGLESFCIEIKKVIQIVQMQKISTIPEVPDFIKGVINLRGKVFPVIDLHLRFGQEEVAYNDRTCIIVVNVEEVYFGFIVDTVDEVLYITEDAIQEAPGFRSSEEKNKYIKGLGKVNEEVIIILDIEKIVEREKIIEFTAEAKAEAVQ